MKTKLRGENAVKVGLRKTMSEHFIPPTAKIVKPDSEGKIPENRIIFDVQSLKIVNLLDNKLNLRSTKPLDSFTLQIFLLRPVSLPCPFTLSDPNPSLQKPNQNTSPPLLQPSQPVNANSAVPGVKVSSSLTQHAVTVSPSRIRKQ